jgi:DMSO/TMAO reductase YedYZ molybdopterin-dependent catalytic subunit
MTGRAPRFTRRQILGATAAAAALAGCDSQEPRRGFLGAMERWNQGVQRLFFSPSRRAPRPGDRWLTAEETFPVYFISDALPPPPEPWSLKIGGLVARPRTLSLDDLTRLPRTDMRVEHHCVEGWSAVADWHGVRVSDIAQLAGADPRAGFVEFRSFDSNYWSSWDRESAFHRQTLLAYGMNGKPLPPAHGAPLRLYGAVKLGYKSVKYLTEVNFLDRPTGGYWEDQGYEWYAGT